MRSHNVGVDSGSHTPPLLSFLSRRRPSRLPTVLILRPSTGVTELGPETRKQLQQSAACAANYGDTRYGWLEKGKPSSQEFSHRISETERTSEIPQNRSSPLSIFRVPFLLPIHKNWGCKDSSRERCSHWARRSWGEPLQAPLRGAAAGA